MTNVSIHQENITIINIYRLNIRTLKYIKYSEVKRDNITLGWNYTLEQMNLIDIYRMFHPIAIKNKQKQKKQKNPHSSQGHMEHSPG